MGAGAKREVERARELRLVAGEADERFAVVEHRPRHAHRRRRAPAGCNGRVVDRAAERAESGQEPDRAERDRDEGQECDQEGLLHLLPSFGDAIERRRGVVLCASMETLDLRISGFSSRSGHATIGAWRGFLLAALGAALGLFAIAIAIREPDALTLPAPVHVAIGWSFVAAGFVAWRQRPDNRMGMLMTLAGIAWFGRDLDWFDSAAAEHASELSLNLFLALVAHQLVVFPHGLARSRLERLLVLAVYGLAVFAYVPSELSDTANTLFSALGIVLAVLIVYVVVRRWLEADPAERRALRPLLVFGPPVMIVAAATIAHDYIGIGLSDTGEDALRWCAVVYAALPLAFLVGVLRTHIRRTILSRLLADLSSGTAVRGRRASRRLQPPRGGRCATTNRCRASSN